ncbi:MAG: 50S ribosomal protein L25 [Flavobacteriales bacterium]|nr:50S ribosomal protein L25 [Flavobacteriales bacterium]MCX7649361.1 50S ribosomal protein L25 [Flavobacteriales bacterium]MDW8432766.1 50S ribosomal protein L25 [Flavobacteriales bacterium]
MKTLQIPAIQRENLGKADSRDRRREGLVPCNVYGAQSHLHILVDERHLKKLVYTPEVIVASLEIEGVGTHRAVVRETQFHPVTDRIIHMDLVEVTDDKPVKVKLPIRLVGNSAGVKAGGKLKTVMRKLHVQGLVQDLPDFVDIDITPLEIGQAIRVRDLNVPGIKFLDSPGNVIVSVAATRASRQEEAAAAPGKK